MSEDDLREARRIFSAEAEKERKKKAAKDAARIRASPDNGPPATTSEPILSPTQRARKLMVRKTLLALNCTNALFNSAAAREEAKRPRGRGAGPYFSTATVPYPLVTTASFD